MAELDWAAKLSLTVGLCAGRLGSTSGWGDGELQMCAYLSYALGVGVLERRGVLACAGESGAVPRARICGTVGAAARRPAATAGCLGRALRLWMV